MRQKPGPNFDSPETEGEQAVRERLRTLGHLGDPATDAPEVLDAQASWKVLRRRLANVAPLADDNAAVATKPATRSVVTPRFRQVGQYALIGALSILAVLGVQRYMAVRTAMNTVASGTTYITHNGQRADIRLPDGSTVVLNVASRLDVPMDFGRGNRTLRLDGEALFTVAHHGRTPFTVIAGPSTTHVLGTQFVVRHYDTDTTATVAVREGKVAVQSSVLSARQQASVQHNGLVTVQPSDPSQFTFASGILTLRLVPLRDAVRELDRWYDVDIRIADTSLVHREVTGSFGTGSSADLANLFETAFDVRVVRNGRTLTLYPR